MRHKASSAQMGIELRAFNSVVAMLWLTVFGLLGLFGLWLWRLLESAAL